MEYGLRVYHISSVRGLGWCRLNPCFNGIWSAREHEIELSAQRPYRVLILVLMEYGLRVSDDYYIGTGEPVLILVLMEYGLRASEGASYAPIEGGLNPCFNGIWSART